MGKFFTWSLAILTVLGALTSPGMAGDKTFRSIGPMEAKTLIETREDLLVIDIRSPEEYAQGALPGSTLIPFWNVVQGNHNLPADKPILLVCAVGGRSYAAGQYLSMKGYREIYNLSGGLSAWARQRVPLPQSSKAAAR